jgi:hypothetical protein
MYYCLQFDYLLSNFLNRQKQYFSVKDAQGYWSKLTALIQNQIILISGQNDDVAGLSEGCLDPETEPSTESR